MRIPGVSGGTDVEADSFIDGNSIQFVKLFQTIIGGFLLLVVGIWIEAMATIVSLHVWIIDGIGAFLSAVVSRTLGVGAEAQIAAWETAAQSSLGTPFGITFALLIEALLLYFLLNAVRDRGVLP
jgi:hypothetical protein